MHPNCKIQSLNQEASRMNVRAEATKTDVDDISTQKEVRALRNKLTILAIILVSFLTLYILF